MLGSTVLAQTDPIVEDMVAAVSKERLTNHVQTLQDFVTRHTYTQGNTDAGDWLYSFFDNLGMQVERHEFTYGTHTEENIIARIPGTVSPDEIVIISGHFDSTSEQPYTLAPGADDDASGIASVLEAAQIFRDYPFERTVEFMCYNAEEQGRRGSIAIAAEYQAAGKNIVAVVNSDMIGYWPTAWQRDLDVAYEPVSEWLADHVISACQRYVRIPIAKHLSGACRDDHYSFTVRGYSAITNMDCWEAHNGGGETTPHYHRTTDTIETLDLDCMTEAVQVNVASVAELAHPQSAVGASEDLWAAGGSPTLLRLTIRPNPFRPSTVVSYHLPSSGPVSLRVFDASGRLVRTLVTGDQPEGNHTSFWRGHDEFGRPAAAGVYYVALRTRAEEMTKPVVLLR
jgi:Zn-dependent M28 family amino/carboxypeptidase